MEITTPVAPAGSWIVRITPGDVVNVAPLSIDTPVVPPVQPGLDTVTGSDTAVVAPAEFDAVTEQVRTCPASAAWTVYELAEPTIVLALRVHA